jgi:hypothetical protein
MSPRHIVQAEIHTCSGCRFSGYPEDFLREISPLDARRLREHLASLRHTWGVPGAPEADAGSVEGTPLPDVQYYWAYKMAAALGEPPRAQAERLLRAYWCLRLAPSAGLPEETKDARARLYLGGAIRKFREALATSADPHIVYIVGELCRRNGNFRLAACYLRRFGERADAARYLKAAAEKLIIAARDRISRGMTMEEIFFDRAPDGRDRI